MTKRLRGPDKKPRKGSPRMGRKVDGDPPRDDSPSRVKRGKALDMLSAGDAVSVVAEACAVSSATVYRWMERPEFAAELDRRLELCRLEAIRVLRAGARDAAASLVGVSRVGGQFDAPKVKASTEVLDRIGVTAPKEVKVEMTGGLAMDLAKLTDEELAARLAELEARKG